MDKKTKNAIKEIEGFIKEIPLLKQAAQPFSGNHVRWLQSCGITLGRIFGAGSVIADNFSNIDFRFSGQIVAPFHNLEKEKEKKHKAAYLRGLEIADGILNSAIDQLRSVGLKELRHLTGDFITAKNKNIFISHGKETKALDKVERFVRTLGFLPIIVKRGASKGMALDDLVEEGIRDSICAIILATADDKVEDYYQPRPNVIHEIGLTQERLNNRIIYLKEKSCKFPSNVAPKVWESFSQDNMEEALEKIIKELKSFDFI